MFVLLLGLSYLLRDSLCDIIQAKCLTEFLVHNNVHNMYIILHDDVICYYIIIILHNILCNIIILYTLLYYIM